MKLTEEQKTKVYIEMVVNDPVLNFIRGRQLQMIGRNIRTPLLKRNRNKRR